MLGIAILGAGDIANVHIEAYQALKGRCEIRALADIFQDKAGKNAENTALPAMWLLIITSFLGERTLILYQFVCLPPPTAKQR